MEATAARRRLRPRSRSSRRTSRCNRPWFRCPPRVIEAVDTRTRGLRAKRNEAVEVASIIRRLDWVLLAATAALVGYGLWAISGITRHDVPGNANYYVVRQGIYAALGLVSLLAVVFVDPDYYRRYRKQIYVGTLGLMVIVLLAGAVTRGSKRWLDLGFFKFQPSEFGKLLFVLFLAALLAGVLFVAGTRWTHLAILGGATLIAAVFVLWILPATGHPVLKH